MLHLLQCVQYLPPAQYPITTDGINRDLRDASLKAQLLQDQRNHPRLYVGQYGTQPQLSLLRNV